MRDLLDGNGPFVLWKTFDHRHPFPERVLFKRVYGTYESFLGETRIYRRATLTFAAYGQGSTLDIDKTRC